MRSKFGIGLLAAALMLLAFSLPAFAQVGQLRGSVEIKQSDGTVVPAAGVQIDVFRTDLSGHYETKTDKKGGFVFAGLPFVGTYIVAASAPGTSPNGLNGVKVGRDIDYKITLFPGNGQRWSEAEAKAAVKNGGGGGESSGASAPKESAEDKAKREELIKKNAEITAQNEKNKNINETLAKTFKAGNEALIAKNYDAAIASFDEGLAADPEQPALLTNKAIALDRRGIEKFNNGARNKVDADTEAGRNDFRAAADAAGLGVKYLKAQTPPTDAAAVAQFNKNKIAALATYAEAMRLFVSNTPDHARADEGYAAYTEYIAAETDPVKKAAAEAQAAKLLFDSNMYDKALAAYGKILERNPDDPDALVYSGMTLFNEAYAANDKEKFQQAANFLQRFVDKAPDTHPLKADAKGVLQNIKDSQNIKPEPTRNAGRRRG